MKMPARPIALLLLLPVLLGGCLQIDTLISVRGDGSGTVRERVAFSGEMASMIREMEDDSGAAGAGVVDRGELEARAASMGPGVKLESAEMLPESEGLGFTAVWSFEDVNELRVAQDAESSVPGEAAPTDAEENVPSATFRFEPGATPVLHVQSSLAGVEAETSSAQVSAAAGGEESQVPPEMLREMFAGLRFSLAVEVEGGIVETNASHREGSRVTLFELDFDQLLQNEAALQALAADDSPDPMRMQAALRGLPGLKVETATDLRIAFAADAAAGESMAGTATQTPDEPAAVELAMPAMIEAEPASMPEPVGTQGAGMSASSTALPSGSIGGFSWRAIEVAHLADRRGELVAVLGADGELTKGMVMAVENGRVRLRRASMDGGGTVELPLEALREASVFEQEG